MEKILVVLMIILFIMIGLLVLVTILSKRKKDGVQSKNDEVIEEITIEPQSEKIDFNDISDAKESAEIIDDFNQVEDFEKEVNQSNEVEQIIDLMQENSTNIVDKVSSYEDEQEENAIISYTELLNAVKSKKEVQEELKFDDIKEPIKETVSFDEKVKEVKKFKSSEAISPLGRISNNASSDSYKSDIKNTNMYKSTNNDDDFLKSLKDFRDTL